MRVAELLAQRRSTSRYPAGDVAIIDTWKVCPTPSHRL